jgi:hypothetical protein
MLEALRHSFFPFFVKGAYRGLAVSPIRKPRKDGLTGFNNDDLFLENGTGILQSVNHLLSQICGRRFK